MAKFVGTVQEFHHLIGPKIRNSVNSAASSHRKQRAGICERCGEKGELQAAHVHGRDRRSLIEGVLKDCTNGAGMVECDLVEIERLIIESHNPIEETFLFLCHKCHIEYDKSTKVPKSKPKTKTEASPNNRPDDEKFQKIHKIKVWAKRSAQINHRIISAFLHLERTGAVEVSALNKYCSQKFGIKTFNQNFASMKTDAGNSHGKVFFEAGGIVKMYPTVRKEIDLLRTCFTGSR